MRRDNYVYSLDGHAMVGKLNTSIEENDNLAQVESLRGKRYFLSIDDDYSRKTRRKVKKLKTDNGLDVCNREFEQLCIESRIARHLTVSETLQQNGLAERMNTTLMDKRLNNHTPKEDQTDQEDGDDKDAGDQETNQTPDLIYYQLARDREPMTRKKPLRFRDESNMAAYAFVAAEEEDIHEPLTYQEAVACKDSSKWKAVIEEDMDSLRKNKTSELVDHLAGQNCDPRSFLNKFPFCLALNMRISAIVLQHRCKQPATTSKAKSLSALSKVAITEAEQLKIATKRSLQQTHISQASGSGADEGISSIPEVLDVPTDESEEEISWNSTDEEGADDNDDEEVAMTEAQQLKLATNKSLQQTHISQASGSGVDEGTGIIPGVPDVPTDDSEEEISWNSTDEEGDDNDDDEGDDGDVGEEGNDDDDAQDDDDQEDERNDEDDQEEGTDDEQASDEEEFIHPSLSTHTEEETRDEESFDPTSKTPKTLMMKAMVKRICQSSRLTSVDRLRNEAQKENDEFLKTIDENMKKIIKEHVKEQVKTSYAVAADLSEMELKKILIEKMEGNKSIHRSNKQRNLSKALVEAYESDKIILDTYEDIVTLKRRHDDDADKGEEPSAGSD
nr:hypothetical protein [Tanacetum cinerariifolium]